MTKQTAYTVPLTCKMWMLFGMYASKHGYGIINEHDCSGFTKKDAISDVTIGSAVSTPLFDSVDMTHMRVCIV